MTTSLDPRVLQQNLPRALVFCRRMSEKRYGGAPQNLAACPVFLPTSHCHPSNHAGCYHLCVAHVHSMATVLLIIDLDKIQSDARCFLASHV